MQIETLIAALNRGIEIARAAYGRDLVALGMPDTLAPAVAQLAETYFGETAFTRKQARARQTSHSLEALLIIERYAARIKGQRERWDFRLKMCALTCPASAVEKAARTAVTRTRALEPGLRVRRRAGLWTLSLIAPSRLVADILATIGSKDPVESFARNYFHGTAKPRLTPLVVMPVGEFLAFEAGGAEDVTFRLDDGSTITGAELAGRKLADKGYLVTTSALSGPICAYRFQRSASFKQRLMLTAELQKCAWAGCQKPASECRAHHIRAWADGGETNPDNLTFLCDYHNGVNDDDPRKPRRGRVGRVGARIAWFPPGGGRPIYAN